MRRTLLIDAIGTVIEIDGSALTDDGWAAVQHAWSGAVVVSDGCAGPSATVTAHGAVITESMLASLSIDVTLAALEQRAGEVLMLHAAGLATDEGRVVVLVGPSGRGKTTASRVLGRDFGYVSDESVGIEADGTVLPYRKPLSIIEDHDHLKAQRSPKELGLRPLPDRPLRVAALGADRARSGGRGAEGGEAGSRRGHRRPRRAGQLSGTPAAPASDPVVARRRSGRRAPRHLQRRRYSRAGDRTARRSRAESRGRAG